MYLLRGPAGSLRRCRVSAASSPENDDDQGEGEDDQQDRRENEHVQRRVLGIEDTSRSHQGRIVGHDDGMNRLTGPIERSSRKALGVMAAVDRERTRAGVADRIAT